MFCLTINGGSSSIKFAMFDQAADPPSRVLSGELQRVGQPGTMMSAKGLGPAVEKQPVEPGDHKAAIDHLIDWLQQRLGDRRISGIGHRVVHGGLKLIDHQTITGEVMDLLKAAAAMDPDHLPGEIELIEAVGRRFPGVPQVACFDTAFFKDLPTLSKMLPIPRSYFDRGIHRFGFHGLSYTYLMRELRRTAGDEAANGRVILAHLGSGASMAAVKNGRPVDTTMAFTPTAGLVMGTRSGDVDPGLLIYLLRTEKLSIQQLDDLLNKQSGLLGVSGTSGDMRDVNGRRATDSRAAEAADLFCYCAKKCIGSYAAALGGVDTIIFAGGIGEHSAQARAQICADLDFVGVKIDSVKNSSGDAVISSGKVVVRVIPTDEEAIIAGEVTKIIAGEKSG